MKPHHLSMHFSLLRLVFPLLVVLLLAGCSPKPTWHVAYGDLDFTIQEFKRVSERPDKTYKSVQAREGAVFLRLTIVPVNHTKCLLGETYAVSVVADGQRYFSVYDQTDVDLEATTGGVIACKQRTFWFNVPDTIGKLVNLTTGHADLTEFEVK